MSHDHQPEPDLIPNLVSDPIPDPEPEVPSLPSPDPAVFHHDVPTKNLTKTDPDESQ